VKQPPQWFGSVCTLTQAPAQHSDWSPELLMGRQTLPQAPQLLGSLLVFVHVDVAAQQVGWSLVQSPNVVPQ
jgi:hypothetical protein